MSIHNRMAALPRNYVKGWLWGARLPLRPIEQLAALAARGGPAPLSEALDRAEAQVKGALGTILRDDALVAESQLARARIDERQAAWRLEAEAEAAKQEADEHYLERRRQADDRRRRAEQEAEARRERAEEKAEERKRRVEERAAEQEKSVRQAEEANEEALRRQRRSAELAQTATERQALEEEKAAVAAEEAADTVDQQLRATKAQRKAG